MLAYIGVYLWLTNLQVNTPAAEVLYTVIQEWAQLDGGSTVLDVCCGTGTIGLALAPVSLLALSKNITLLCYHEPEDWVYCSDPDKTQLCCVFLSQATRAMGLIHLSISEGEKSSRD